ncbi:MAG: hypothetical protein ACKOI3_09200, partial [Actinomycetota bacterium]
MREWWIVVRFFGEFSLVVRNYFEHASACGRSDARTTDEGRLAVVHAVTYSPDEMSFARFACNNLREWWIVVRFFGEFLRVVRNFFEHTRMALGVWVYSADWVPLTVVQTVMNLSDEMRFVRFTCNNMHRRRITMCTR